MTGIPDRFRDYARDTVNRDGTVNNDRFTQLLNDLSDLARGATGSVSERRVIIGGGGLPSPTDGGGGGGGGGTAPNGNPNERISIGVAIPNSINAKRGNLIYRNGSTVGLADNRDYDKQATDYVYATEPGLMWITPIYKARNKGGEEIDGIVLLASGAGTQDSAILYLHRDGTATDVRTQIIDSEGYFQNDAEFVQQVGIRVGSKRSTFVVADINIHRPGTG